jgi:hypothetical protein
VCSSDLNKLWMKYYDEQHNIINKLQKGTNTWMDIWCPKKWYPLQCDISAMLSPKMFEEFVVPNLTEHCNWLDYSIYHLDGPSEIPHLDLLLDIPRLTGIQWTSGAGTEPEDSPKWIDMYKKILSKNKTLVLMYIRPDKIKSLVDQLGPKGLLIQTYCNTESEAKELLKQVKGN